MTPTVTKRVKANIHRNAAHFQVHNRFTTRITKILLEKRSYYITNIIFDIFIYN